MEIKYQIPCGRKAIQLYQKLKLKSHFSILLQTSLRHTHSILSLLHKSAFTAPTHRGMWHDFINICPHIRLLKAR